MGKQLGVVSSFQTSKQIDVLTKELARRIKGQLYSDFEQYADELIKATQAKAENIASRKASQNCIAAFGKLLPELLGGSADLMGSNLTNWSGSVPISRDAAGNYIYYGVREFGMGAINNGIALHGGFIPYCATFLVFMEYMRNSVRMAALMKQHSIFVFTHDSIGQGEDGPTHQPIEQIANLRGTPNMTVWRPADATGIRRLGAGRRKHGFPPAESSGYLVRDAHRAFQRLLEKRIADYAVNRGRWYFLGVLWSEDGCRSASSQRASAPWSRPPSSRCAEWRNPA